MNRLAVVALGMLALVVSARGAAAQSVINGTAELDAYESSTQTSGQDSANGSFGQSYTLGWVSSLWDPRLVRYNAQGTFRTSTQNLTSTGQTGLHGRSSDFGYALGANLLQSSAMPFFIQASRTRDTSAGDFAPLNQLRGIALAATGVPASDFEAINRDLNLGWHVGIGGLPRVDLAYRRANAITSGGGYQATQDSSDFSGSLATSSTVMSQSLRYQATSTENVLQQTFSQRLGYLDYDFNRTVSRRSRMTARAGRRTTFAQSVFQVPVDPNSGAYAPAVTSGNSTTEYAQAGYAWDPGPRYSIHADGNAEHQTGDMASTSALLASLSAHVMPVSGLDVFAAGSTGTRHQVVGGDPLAVTTRTASTGLTYQVNGRHLGAGAGLTRGIGTNATVDGRTGATDSWSGEAHATARLNIFSANAGYERARFHDAILDFGNYDDEQVRGSVQVQTQRGSLSVDAADLHVSRGRMETFLKNAQRTISTTASLRVFQQSFLAVTAGRFANDYESAQGPGTDRTTYWSVNFDAPFRRTLRFSSWLRSENAFASRTLYSQDGISGQARLDYRLRTLTFQLEYRRNRNHTVYPTILGSNTFAGSQIRFSVIRQFGARVR